MDWKGKLSPESPILNGKIHGFRSRFSLKTPIKGTCTTWLGLPQWHHGTCKKAQKVVVFADENDGILNHIVDI